MLQGIVIPGQLGGACTTQDAGRVTGGLPERRKRPDLGRRRRSIVLIVSEEGKLQGMPINNRATSYLYAVAPEWRGWDVLAGPVLIMGNGDGEFTSGPQAVIEAVGLQ